ncbi:MAG: M23 family metallopeptidase [Pseudomonadota bacterium]
MLAKPITTLALAGVVAGCTSYVPVQQGAGTWQDARQQAYAPPATTLAAPTTAGRATDAPVVDLAPIDPASGASGYDPKPLPPLRAGGQQNPGWPTAEPAVNPGWPTADATVNPGWPTAETALDQSWPTATVDGEPLVAAAEAAAPATDPLPAATAAAAATGAAAVAASSTEVDEVVEVVEPSVAAAATTTAGNVADVQNLQPPALSGVGFLWPVEGTVADAGASGIPGHVANGLTIRTASGTPFVASENGVVVFAGSSIESYGQMVVVRHDGDYTTAYGHAERLDVAMGDVVRRGQALGLVGDTGAVTEPQLYYEMRIGSRVVDPRAYLMGTPKVAAR